MNLLFARLFTFILLFPIPAFSSGFLQGTIWERAAMEKNIDPMLLYSVTICESAHQAGPNQIKPWPYALNVNGYGISYYPNTRQEAENILEYLRSRGIIDVDVGLGQVNLRYHGHKVNRPAELLDPTTNLQVASGILKEALSSCNDPVLGVGRYHSWTSWRAKSYGAKVIKLYNRLQNYTRTTAPFNAPKDISLLFPVVPRLRPSWSSVMEFDFATAPIRRIIGGD
jgi:Transglycosylase SLT domain